MTSQSLAQRSENARTPATQTPQQAIRDVIDKNSQAIGMSLPSGMDSQRFGRLLLTAANTNPALFRCDPRSFLAAGVTAAQLGLEPNDPRGLAYLIPFKNQVQLIIGYRGMMELARRSGLVSSINAFPVFEGDEFTYRLGLDPTLDHVPAEDGDEDPKKLTHVYAVAKVNGDPQFVVLSRKQIDKARGRSASGNSSSSPWNTDYVAMALKTAIKRLCKYLPQTVEMAQALDHDNRALTLGDFGGISAVGDDGHVEDAIEATYSAAPEGVNAETGELIPKEAGAA
jgi:recombination protein RecT